MKTGGVITPLGGLDKSLFRTKITYCCRLTV